MDLKKINEAVENLIAEADEDSSHRLSGVYKTLYDAIKEHAGLDDSEIRDAAEHGADSGYGGFTYYKDTVKFHDNNEAAIWELLDQEAGSMGSGNVLEFIASMGGAKNVGDMDQLKNLLAWYALETVGHALE